MERNLKSVKEILAALEEAKAEISAFEEDTVTALSYSSLEYDVIEAGWGAWALRGIVWVRGIQFGFPSTYKTKILGITQDNWAVVLTAPDNVVSGWTFVKKEKIFLDENRKPLPTRRPRSRRVAEVVEA